MKRAPTRGALGLVRRRSGHEEVLERTVATRDCHEHGQRQQFRFVGAESQEGERHSECLTHGRARHHATRGSRLFPHPRTLLVGLPPRLFAERGRRLDTAPEAKARLPQLPAAGAPKFGLRPNGGATQARCASGPGAGLRSVQFDQRANSVPVFFLYRSG